MKEDDDEANEDKANKPTLWLHTHTYIYIYYFYSSVYNWCPIGHNLILYFGPAKGAHQRSSCIYLLGYCYIDLNYREPVLLVPALRPV